MNTNYHIINTTTFETAMMEMPSDTINVESRLMNDELWIARKQKDCAMEMNPLVMGHPAAKLFGLIVVATKFVSLSAHIFENGDEYMMGDYVSLNMENLAKLLPINQFDLEDAKRAISEAGFVIEADTREYYVKLKDDNDTLIIEEQFDTFVDGGQHAQYLSALCHAVMNDRFESECPSAHVVFKDQLLNVIGLMRFEPTTTQAKPLNFDFLRTMMK